MNIAIRIAAVALLLVSVDGHLQRHLTRHEFSPTNATTDAAEKGPTFGFTLGTAQAFWTRWSRNTFKS
jgi:hypothetical protein